MATDLSKCRKCGEFRECNHVCKTEGTKDDAGKHYRYEYKGVKLDPYRIMQIYKIADPAQQHAIKKLLRAGQSVKTLRQDVEEAIMTLSRWLEMMDEDQVDVEEDARRLTDQEAMAKFFVEHPKHFVRPPIMPSFFVGETKGPDTLPAKPAQEEQAPIEYTPEHIGTGW